MFQHERSASPSDKRGSNNTVLNASNFPVILSNDSALSHYNSNLTSVDLTQLLCVFRGNNILRGLFNGSEL